MQRPDRRTGARALGFVFALLAALAPAVVPSPSAAQVPAIDPRVLEQLQGQLGAARPPNASEQLDDAREAAAVPPVRDERVRPDTAEERAVRRERSRLELAELAPASAIELEFRQRTGDPTLRQFGYDLFSTAQGSGGGGALTGSVGGDYVLGIGDELVVNFQGATNDSRTARVDREGRLVVGQLPPVRAAGRTLSSVRAELAASTRRTLLGTDLSVSVGSVRAITVFVGGEVLSPGQYQLTSLADVVSALAQAGGIRRSGTLRRVRIARGGGTIEVDLYGLLGIGAPPTTRLREGDRIIVPVIGTTVAIAGGVARPGIYELRGRLSVGALLDYAGGAVRPRGSRIAISRITADGSEVFVRAPTATAAIEAGDAVQVIGGSAGGATGRVLLRGFVLNPGPRPIGLAPTVRDLVGERGGLRPGTYLPMAVLIRRDLATGARRFIPVNLGSALGGGDPVALRSEDRVYVLSGDDAEFINRASVRRIALGQPNTETGCRPLERLEELVRDTQSQRYAVITRGTFITTTGEVAGVGSTLAQRSTIVAGEQVRPARDATTSGAGQGRGARPLDETENDITCPAVFQEEPELLPVLIENSVSVGGAVRRPGAYPVAGIVRAATLETLAEGLLTPTGEIILDVTRATGSATTQARYAVVPGGPPPLVELRPGDDIRFNAGQPQFEAGAVLVTGEVGRPGLFTIKKGERLSELLARAGGVTELSYPYGAVFTRRSVREAQQDGFRRTGRELNEALLALAARKSEGNSDSLIAAGQFVANLSDVEAQGRVVIEADPRVLAIRPDLDTTLEAGDAIFIPKQPTYVLALGDLSNPGALQFVPGKNVGEYLRESGGLRQTADDDRVFVVLPNGSAQPTRAGFGRRSSLAPPPGSTIIVPKNLDPLLGLDIARDVVTIVGQFVSSIATVAILARQ